MKILIVGGNRFIGKGLADKLCPGHSVTVFNRSGNGPENVSIIQGDRNIARSEERR
jgi:nucleoside-diphosphate-sugar epimerase